VFLTVAIGASLARSQQHERRLHANRLPGDNRMDAWNKATGWRRASVKLSQILSFPNQLTLMRMMFLPFIVIKLVEGYYSSALILFVLAGISDGLDGLMARTLQQQTRLGQYLDPIADKLLLSTVFLVLSILHKIPWKFTVLVFSRDISILAASAVLYAIAGLRDFRPSIFGKANTFAQVAAVFFVLLLQVHPARWIAITRLTFLRAVFAFTIISALHYVLLVGQRLRALPQES
jgi:cardiolipin synthase (CMP-forming)